MLYHVSNFIELILKILKGSSQNMFAFYCIKYISVPSCPCHECPILLGIESLESRRVTRTMFIDPLGLLQLTKFSVPLYSTRQINLFFNNYSQIDIGKNKPISDLSVPNKLSPNVNFNLGLTIQGSHQNLFLSHC